MPKSSPISRQEILEKEALKSQCQDWIKIK